jgi:hypothetical protein
MVIHSGGKILIVSLGTGTSLFFLRRTVPLLLTPMSENVQALPARRPRAVITEASSASESGNAFVS